jgi:predicted Zn-dependent protease
MKFGRISRYSLGVALVLITVPHTNLFAQAVQVVQAISQKDKDQGAKYHPQLTAEYGGAMSGPYADYVGTVGKKIAVQSGLSNSSSDFTVTLLNSSVNNAFAIPGGYVYTTRQLVALMNNEAELAGVLGHEVGHVAARHSARRQSEATKNQVIGIGGAILAGVLLGNNSQVGQILQKGFLQLPTVLTLKYSRKQENEADALGVAYLKKAGYDPRAMSTVLQSLASQNALDARMLGTSDQVPVWASSHPDPALRVRTTQALAGTVTGNTHRDLFLTRINGMTYGDSAEQGFVEGRRFAHPIYRMGFEAPAGFHLVNGNRAVAIGGQGGKGQFTQAQFDGDLDAYVRNVFSTFGQANQAQLNPSEVQRTTVNGIQAAYALARVASSSGQIDVTVFAYQWDAKTAYHFITMTKAGSDAFRPMFNSMKRLSAAETAALKPRRLVVVTVRKGDTVQSLAARMAYTDAPLDRFRVLNGLGPNAALAVGQKVKIVTY